MYRNVCFPQYRPNLSDLGLSNAARPGFKRYSNSVYLNIQFVPRGKHNVYGYDKKSVNIL